MPERPSTSPNLMLVSVSPSVCDQPDGHLDRSVVKPSAPVNDLPSEETPQPPSLIRCTIAARSFVQSASQSAIEVGRAAAGPALVVLPCPPAAEVLAAPPATLVVVAASPSSLPHATSVLQARPAVSSAAHRIPLRVMTLP